MSKNNTKPRFTTQFICLTAVMTALYVLLTMISINTATMRFTLASLPTVICAVISGPFQAVLVAGIGEFINQILKYGLSTTTILWIIPPMIRVLIIGLIANKFRNQPKHLENRTMLFYTASVLSAIITTIINTLSLYLDSKIWGYYTFAYVFSTLAQRFITGIITSVIVTTIVIPIAILLRKQKLMSL